MPILIVKAPRDVATLPAPKPGRPSSVAQGLEDALAAHHGEHDPSVAPKWKGAWVGPSGRVIPIYGEGASTSDLHLTAADRAMNRLGLKPNPAPDKDPYGEMYGQGFVRLHMFGHEKPPHMRTYAPQMMVNFGQGRLTQAQYDALDALHGHHEPQVKWEDSSGRSGNNLAQLLWHVRPLSKALIKALMAKAAEMGASIPRLHDILMRNHGEGFPDHWQRERAVSHWVYPDGRISGELGPEDKYYHHYGSADRALEEIGAKQPAESHAGVTYGKFGYPEDEVMHRLGLLRYTAGGRSGDRYVRVQTMHPPTEAQKRSLGKMWADARKAGIREMGYTVQHPETGWRVTEGSGFANWQRDPLVHSVQEIEKALSEAQKEAGNYKKEHIRVQGLAISIENPKGSIRSGEGWSVKMAHDYGYITGFGDASDGDHPDVFVGPNRESDWAFIVDQVDQDGKFDEHKILLGFDSAEQAKAGYLACYTKGWKCGKMCQVSIERLKEMLREGKFAKKRPIVKAVVVITKAPQPQTTPGPYNNEIAYLRDYLKGGFNPSDFAHHLPDFYADYGEEWPETNGEPHDEYDVAESMDADHKDRFSMWLGDRGVGQGALYDDPPYTAMDFHDLHKPKHLVHFTPNAAEIAKHGFQYGHPDMYEGLHLTTWKKDRHKEPGYNFAYDASGADGLNSSYNHTYGSQAVVFPSTGVKVFHYGDEDHQHVFWGPSVKPADIHHMYHDDNTGEWHVPDATGRIRKQGTYEQAVDFIQNNHQMLSNIKRKHWGIGKAVGVRKAVVVIVGIEKAYHAGMKGGWAREMSGARPAAVAAPKPARTPQYKPRSAFRGMKRGWQRQILGEDSHGLPIHPNCRCSVVELPDGRSLWQLDDAACPQCRNRADAWNARYMNVPPEDTSEDGGAEFADASEGIPDQIEMDESHEHAH